MDTLYSLMPLIFIILIMYFLLIRPQKKREKQINAMRANIKVGDEVITIGGIYGTVVRVKDEQLVIQVGADKTRLEVTRWAISKVLNEEPVSSKPASKDEPKEETKKARPKRLDKASSADTESDPPENKPLESEVKEEKPLEEE